MLRQDDPHSPDWNEVRSALTKAMRERILILDGAMGTMLQRLKFDEAAFRGERFTNWHLPLQGNNDLLVLTQPQAVEDIHFDYFMAGADIVETNTFSATSVAQADYGCEDVVYDLNYHGVLLLSGGRSDVVSRQTVAEFMQLVPQLEHVELPQATHMVAGDANDAFTREIIRFVQRLDLAVARPAADTPLSR